MKSLIPHALPYVAFVSVGSLEPWLGQWTDLVRVLATGLALLWFWMKGRYPELSAAPSPLHAVAGIVAGIAVGIAWVPLARIVPLLSVAGARDGPDPLLAGQLVLSPKILAMVFVVPFAEELLVRSAIPRFFDAKPDADWRANPVGVFTTLSASVSVAFFTLTHPEWLAALATGVLWTALLAWTRNLRVLVISHAVANAWLAVYIVKTGEKQWW